MSDTRVADRAPWTLRAVGLCVDRGRRRVLEDVRFELRRGQCLCVIGPNGAGKTSLLLTVLGLLRPSAGGVWLDERRVDRMTPRQRARFAALVPQSLEHVPPFTVRQLVEDARHAHRPPWAPPGPDDRQAVERALTLCGVAELAHRRVDRLSGGERQKALLAAALAQEPQLLVLDEPTTALDPAYRVELVRILRQIHARGTALLVVSHELELPILLGGRTLALRAGRVVADGDTAAVLEPDRLEALYGARFEHARTEGGARFVLPDYGTATP